MAFVAVLLLAIVAGALVYSALVVYAAHHYLAVKPAGGETAAAVSVLKPLAGAEDGLERNLRSFFEQDYPDFELLFAVREASDPAAGLVDRLRREYPRVAARLIVTGEPPYPNAKVFSLDRMLAEARHDLVVMSDSDVRVTPDMLRVVAAEFQDERLGLATCPYRAVPGQGFWSSLEAIGMNTEFLAGILVARIVEGMKFAVGPTIVARRAALASIGGFDRVKDFLAEDFVLGKFVAESGWRVILSSCVIEHHIGGQGFAASARHRLRWVRSTRRSRPGGYIGQIFTYPLLLALLLLAAEASWWPVLIAAALLRALSAWAVAGWVLHDPLTLRRWFLVPVEDLVSFAFWVAGFFGNTIQWRGRKYSLRADGRFDLLQ
ncbi:MAG TPA: bacteriohopanetetrol glucosamine biosynthesis glycosyltransferase HpnI [Bryobacteraceae bacterium]|nr:bacteriohopanetetrol glucosamine biosynthesis glycosyltransferase HpnI [Bryobacteraceae bacterium]